MQPVQMGGAFKQMGGAFKQGVIRIPFWMILLFYLLTLNYEVLAFEPESPFLQDDDSHTDEQRRSLSTSSCSMCSSSEYESLHLAADTETSFYLSMELLSSGDCSHDPSTAEILNIDCFDRAFSELGLTYTKFDGYWPNVTNCHEESGVDPAQVFLLTGMNKNRLDNINLKLSCFSYASNYSVVYDTLTIGPSFSPTPSALPTPSSTPSPSTSSLPCHSDHLNMTVSQVTQVAKTTNLAVGYMDIVSGFKRDGDAFVHVWQRNYVTNHYFLCLKASIKDRNISSVNVKSFDSTDRYIIDFSYDQINGDRQFQNIFWGVYYATCFELEQYRDSYSDELMGWNTPILAEHLDTVHVENALEGCFALAANNYTTEDKVFSDGLILFACEDSESQWAVKIPGLNIQSLYIEQLCYSSHWGWGFYCYPSDYIISIATKPLNPPDQSGIIVSWINRETGNLITAQTHSSTVNTNPQNGTNILSNYRLHAVKSRFYHNAQLFLGGTLERFKASNVSASISSDMLLSIFDASVDNPKFLLITNEFTRVDVEKSHNAMWDLSPTSEGHVRFSGESFVNGVRRALVGLLEVNWVEVEGEYPNYVVEAVDLKQLWVLQAEGRNCSAKHIESLGSLNDYRVVIECDEEDYYHLQVCNDIEFANTGAIAQGFEWVESHDLFSISYQLESSVVVQGLQEIPLGVNISRASHEFSIQPLLSPTPSASVSSSPTPSASPTSSVTSSPSMTSSPTSSASPTSSVTSSPSTIPSPTVSPLQNMSSTANSSDTEVKPSARASLGPVAECLSLRLPSWFCDPVFLYVLTPLLGLSLFTMCIFAIVYRRRNQHRELEREGRDDVSEPEHRERPPEIHLSDLDSVDSSDSEKEALAFLNSSDSEEDNPGEMSPD